MAPFPSVPKDNTRLHSLKQANNFIKIRFRYTACEAISGRFQDTELASDVRDELKLHFKKTDGNRIYQLWKTFSTIPQRGYTASTQSF